MLILVIIFITPLAEARIADLRSYGPLTTRSQNPLYLQFLALPMEAPTTLNRGQFETTVSTTFSNTFEFSPATNTTVNLDMETWRHAVSIGWGVTDAIDVKVEIPFVTGSGGFLDSFVQWYHGFVGVPNGGREFVANGLFTYSVSQGGTTLASHSSRGLAFSDMTLRGKIEISQYLKLPLKLAVAPYVKLPTGSTASGFSSGHLDAGLSVIAQLDFFRFHLFEQAGFVYVGGHDTLAGIMRPVFFTFGQGFEFQWADGFSTIVQLTGNTPLFKNTDAPELSEIILDLNVGFAGSFVLQDMPFDELFYQASFSEDVMGSGPSTDFSALFLVGVRY